MPAPHPPCILVLAILLNVALEGRAACNPPTVYTEQFRATALDLSLDGNDLWVATNYGVALYDRTVDPPLLRGSVAVPGPTTTVRAFNGVAYVGSGRSLYVVTRSGGTLTLGASFDVASSIRDTLLFDSHLYIATETGVVVVSVIQPANPSVGRLLATGTGGALSLARIGTTLYVADGDTSVEAFDLRVPSAPARLGAVNTARRAISVTANGTRLYVSDGLRTEFFSGSGISLSRDGETERFGVSALTGTSSGLVFVAGNDRTLRAVDLTSSTPAVLFETSSPISGGTVNRVVKLAATANRLYAAAGDAGLLTYDTSAFSAPFAIRSQAIGTADSLIATGSSVIVAPSAGGLRQYSTDQAGTLNLVREWDGTTTWNVRDLNGTRLLTTAGSTFKVHDLLVTPPRTIISKSFPRPVTSAALTGDAVYAVLSDQTLWRADLVIGTAVRIGGVGAPSAVARGGNALALVESAGSGVTTVRFYSTGDPLAVPRAATIEGFPVGRVAVSTTGIVAAATFRGLSVVDFNQSPPVLRTASIKDASDVRSIVLSGDRVVILTGMMVQLLDLSTLKEVRSYPLPGENHSLSLDAAGGNVAFVAGNGGVTTLLLDREAGLPQLLSAAATNEFFRKLVGSDQLLALFDGRKITLMKLRSDGLPDRASRVSGAIAVDVAVVGDRAYGLSGSGKVTAYTSSGTPVADYQINEGSETVPLTIAAIAGALYVSVSRCPGGVCENKTVVLDPRNGMIAPSATMSGAIVDVVVEGTRAFVLSNFPREIRIFNLADPYRPALVNSRVPEGAPVSIAYDARVDTLYTLGSTVIGYDPLSLSRKGELLNPYVAESTGRLTINDQRLRIFGDCAVVVGREFGPQFFEIKSALIWSPELVAPSPAAFRSIFTRSGFLYLLSDYSLEVRSSSVPGTARSRATRR
ncbi:MAG TPA: hypothetical protein VNM92_16770 [Thermoanaerobaculia bacterium]|nr:hypothetical protein [Thermoanaerobaculia bacterium]